MIYVGTYRRMGDLRLTFEYLRSEKFKLYDNTLLVVQAASVANHLQDTGVEKVDRIK